MACCASPVYGTKERGVGQLLVKCIWPVGDPDAMDLLHAQPTISQTPVNQPVQHTEQAYRDTISIISLRKWLILSRTCGLLLQTYFRLFSACESLLLWISVATACSIDLHTGWFATVAWRISLRVNISMHKSPLWQPWVRRRLLNFLYDSF